MKKFLHLLALAAMFMFVGCEKKEDDDPFDFPDTEQQPTTVKHMTREIITADNNDKGLKNENWTVERSQEGCKEPSNINLYVLNEINQQRGFISMQLVPDTLACNLNVTVKSPFRKEEIASDYWDNWKFEFTFSELRLTEFANLRLRLKYREVELDLDVAPIMRQVFPPDTVFVDANGLFVFSIEETFTDFSLNGLAWEPDFTSESGNTLNLNHDGTDEHLEVSLSSSQSSTQSFLVFQYVRISSFGIPEE